MLDAQVNLTVNSAVSGFVLCFEYCMYYIYTPEVNIYLDFQFYWVSYILLEWREEGKTDKLGNTWKFHYCFSCPWSALSDLILETHVNKLIKI